ncbi:unnamed protein product, partial [Prunus brigantina]
MVKNRKKDSRALMYIFGAIDPAVYEKIAHVSTSKEAWDVVSDYFTRTLALANQMKANGEEMKELQIVEKILRTLTDRFEGKVTAIEETRDLSTLTVDELQGSLQ